MGGKGQVIFRGAQRLQAKDFNLGAGLPLKMHAGGYNPGVIEDHERIGRKKFRQVTEYFFLDFSFFIMQKLGGIPLLKRVFCYSFL